MSFSVKLLNPKLFNKDEKIVSFPDLKNPSNLFLFKNNDLYYLTSDKKLTFKTTIPFDLKFDLKPINKNPPINHFYEYTENYLYLMIIETNKTSKYLSINLETFEIESLSYCDFYYKLPSNRNSYDERIYNPDNKKVFNYLANDYRYHGFLPPTTTEESLINDNLPFLVDEKHRKIIKLELVDDKVVILEEKMTEVESYQNECPETERITLYYATIIKTPSEYNYQVFETFNLCEGEKICDFLVGTKFIWIELENEVIVRFNYHSKESVKFQLIDNKVIFSNFQIKSNREFFLRKDSYVGGLEFSIVNSYYLLPSINRKNNWLLDERKLAFTDDFELINIPYFTLEKFITDTNALTVEINTFPKFKKDYSLVKFTFENDEFKELKISQVPTELLENDNLPTSIQVIFKDNSYYLIKFLD